MAECAVTQGAAWHAPDTLPGAVSAGVRALPYSAFQSQLPTLLTEQFEQIDALYALGGADIRDVRAIWFTRRSLAGHHSEVTNLSETDDERIRLRAVLPSINEALMIRQDVGYGNLYRRINWNDGQVLLRPVPGAIILLLQFGDDSSEAKSFPSVPR